MKQYIETFKRLYSSESINEEQRNQIIATVNRLYDAGKITNIEKEYILGKEE